MLAGRPMFACLNAHHDSIVAAASHLEQLVIARQPDVLELASARLAIARLSRSRVNLLETVIYPTLRSDLGERGIASVQTLREERLRYLAKTSRHIAAWNSRRVADELPEFRRVLTGFLASLRARVDAEAITLGPLIERARTVQPASLSAGSRSSRFRLEPACLRQVRNLDLSCRRSWWS